MIGKYKHYKGDLYQVLSLCEHSETMEKLVYYQALYGDYKFWVRPYDMFFEKVKINGELKDRFELIEDDKLTK